jgi:hypothetical protein
MARFHCLLLLSISTLLYINAVRSDALQATHQNHQNHQNHQHHGFTHHHRVRTLIKFLRVSFSFNLTNKMKASYIVIQRIYILITSSVCSLGNSLLVRARMTLFVFLISMPFNSINFLHGKFADFIMSLNL